MSIEILDCLKHERDICVKHVILSKNMAFMWIPALRWLFGTSIAHQKCPFFYEQVVYRYVLATNKAMADVLKEVAKFAVVEGPNLGHYCFKSVQVSFRIFLAVVVVSKLAK